MAFFWCTEALPLAVTALLPIILFPMMGIMNSSEVSLPCPMRKGFWGWRGLPQDAPGNLITGRHRRGSLPLLGRSDITVGEIIWKTKGEDIVELPSVWLVSRVNSK